MIFAELLLQASSSEPIQNVNVAALRTNFTSPITPAILLSAQRLSVPVDRRLTSVVHFHEFGASAALPSHREAEIRVNIRCDSRPSMASRASACAHDIIFTASHMVFTCLSSICSLGLPSSRLARSPSVMPPLAIHAWPSSASRKRFSSTGLRQ